MMEQKADIHNALSQPLICYLPGRWANGASWALDDEERDIRRWMERRGVMVAGVSYRTAYLQNDLQTLRSVGLSDIVEDAEQAVRSLRCRYPGRPVVCIGYSLGASVAVLLESKYPGIFSGVVLLDGGLAPGKPGNLPRGDLVSSVRGSARFRRLAQASIEESSSGVGRSHAAWGMPRDYDQYRFLLDAHDTWWPTRVLTDIDTAASNSRAKLQWELGETPVLGVVSRSSGFSAERCRRSVQARRRSLTSVIELPGDWTHVDVASHPRASCLWSSVYEWINDAVSQHAIRDGGIDVCQHLKMLSCERSQSVCRQSAR